MSGSRELQTVRAMIEVCLPIAPISKKILRSEYGAAPISLQKHDLMYQVFLIKKMPGSKPNILQSRKILTEELSFAVSPRLGKMIIENALDIGMFLYNLHMRDMCKFVYAKWEEKESINVKGAVTNFYARHNIDEDDFALESAYKRVQRFFWKKIEENPSFWSKKETKEVRLNLTQKTLRLKGLLLFSEQEIVNIHNAFFLAFYAKSHNAPETYTGYFQDWLDYYYRGIPVVEIAEKKELTDHAIYKRIRNFNFQLVYDIDFRAMVLDVLIKFLPVKTGKVLPIAV